MYKKDKKQKVYYKADKCTLYSDIEKSYQIRAWLQYWFAFWRVSWAQEHFYLVYVEWQRSDIVVGCDEQNRLNDDGVQNGAQKKDYLEQQVLVGDNAWRARSGPMHNGSCILAGHILC